MENNLTQRKEIDFEKLKCLEGHFVEFEKELWFDSKTKAKFMRVTGGFGATYGLMGTMILGDFYESIRNFQEGKKIISSNTRAFPRWYYPQYFKGVQ